LTSYDYTAKTDVAQISLPEASTPQLSTESPRNLVIGSPFKNITLFQLRKISSWIYRANEIICEIWGYRNRADGIQIFWDVTTYRII